MSKGKAAHPDTDRRRQTSAENGRKGGRPSTGREKHTIYVTAEEYQSVKQHIETLREKGQ